MVSLKKHLDTLRSTIDAALHRYLPSARQSPRVIHRAMRYSVFGGGKRLRPILSIESCCVCGGTRSQALPVACALELIHAYSLVHDDLPSMDNDDFRRGKFTAHKKFGEAYAILAGDALLTLAFNILAKHAVSRYSLCVIREISEAVGSHGMINGQAADLKMSRKKKSSRQRDYINKHKTAVLMGVSVKTGAMVAGASWEKTAALSRFGNALGILFQYTDDMIDNERHITSIGMRAAKKKALQYSKYARGCLCSFGKRAHRLREITDYIATREI